MSRLGWEALADRRRITRLSLFYKGLHGQAPIPVIHPDLRVILRPALSFLYLPESMPSSTLSFPGRWWIGIRYRMKIVSNPHCHLSSLLFLPATESWP